ncbi:Mitochondrial tRNA-specific 2-thiouridylase 1, partial [Trachymyrmex septentrionalis]
QIANVLLENDCIAGRENVSDRCPLSLVSCEESSSRIVPSTNLDTTDVEYLCYSWISITNANDGIWNPYASLQLDDTIYKYPILSKTNPSIKYIISLCNATIIITFFLSQISQQTLRRCMFPFGNYLKTHVKVMAIQAGLFQIARKKESVGSTTHSALYTDFLITRKIHWISEEPCELKWHNGVLNCNFRFQHRDPLIACRVYKMSNDRLFICLDAPLRAIIKG